MHSELCDKLGIEFPLFGFNHCRDVVVEISKAGGMGILGAAGLTPEALEIELKWIDEHIDSKPYGVDLIAPTSMRGQEKMEPQDLESVVPAESLAYARQILAGHNIDTKDIYPKKVASAYSFLAEEAASDVMDVAFAHPIAMIVNALGVPPQSMLDRAREQGVATGALVGNKEHALKQAKAGVDVLIASGGEAGGHCGEIATIVLIPEVLAAVKDYDVAVLAAGGIIKGRQMAACMAMGAQGAWTGSMWLTTKEAATSEVIKEKFLAASSGQTVRSKYRTGKFSRQLRSPWTDSWESDEAPAPLPMPLQGLVSEPALARVTKLAEGGHAGARELATFWVGQGVGLMTETLTTRQVIYEFMEDFLEATERLKAIMED